MEEDATFACFEFSLRTLNEVFSNSIYVRVVGEQWRPFRVAHCNVIDAKREVV